MHTRRSWLATVAGIVLWSGCVKKREPADPLRVALGTRPTMGPIHLALERGFFADEGVDVVRQEVESNQQAVPLLVGGAVDVGLFGFVPSVPNAIARGARIRIVAGRDAIEPGCSDQSAMYYRRKRFPNGMSSRSDWVDARVALSSANSTAEFYLDEVLRSVGVGHDEVRVSRMTMEEAVTAAVAGRLDIFFGSGRPDMLDTGLPPDVVRTDLPVRTLGSLQFSHVLFGARLLDGSPASGVAFMRAYLRGVKAFVAGETPRYFDEYARRFRLDAARLRNACRTNIAVDGELRMKDLQRWLTWASAKGYLSAPMTAEDIVDLRFQRAAQGLDRGANP